MARRRASRSDPGVPGRIQPSIADLSCPDGQRRLGPGSSRRRPDQLCSWVRPSNGAASSRTVPTMTGPSSHALYDTARSRDPSRGLSCNALAHMEEPGGGGTLTLSDGTVMPLLGLGVWQ